MYMEQSMKYEQNIISNFIIVKGRRMESEKSIRGLYIWDMVKIWSSSHNQVHSWYLQDLVHECNGKYIPCLSMWKL